MTFDARPQSAGERRVGIEVEKLFVFIYPIFPAEAESLGGKDGRLEGRELTRLCFYFFLIGVHSAPIRKNVRVRALTLNIFYSYIFI